MAAGVKGHTPKKVVNCTNVSSPADVPALCSLFVTVPGACLRGFFFGILFGDGRLDTLGSCRRVSLGRFCEIRFSDWDLVCDVFLIVRLRVPWIFVF